MTEKNEKERYLVIEHSDQSRSEKGDCYVVEALPEDITTDEQALAFAKSWRHCTGKHYSIFKATLVCSTMRGVQV